MVAAMLVLISHRGNINELNPEKENSSEYIDDAIYAGYDVEIDVRLINGNLYLGHDTPDYQLSLDWLLDRKDKLWVHCKNFDALQYLITENLRIFYHQKENHTIINKCNIIWSHELSEANYKSIIPLLSKEDINNYQGNFNNIYGTCSDFVEILREKIK